MLWTNTSREGFVRGTVWRLFSILSAESRDTFKIAVGRDHSERMLYVRERPGKEAEPAFVCMETRMEVWRVKRVFL